MALSTECITAIPTHTEREVWACRRAGGAHRSAVSASPRHWVHRSRRDHRVTGFTGSPSHRDTDSPLRHAAVSGVPSGGVGSRRCGGGVANCTSTGGTNCRDGQPVTVCRANAQSHRELQCCVGGLVALSQSTCCPRSARSAAPPRVTSNHHVLSPREVPTATDARATTCRDPRTAERATCGRHHCRRPVLYQIRVLHHDV